ncbi:MAG: hypothetical protein QM737_15560 [Ferruginibacter sp.]
MKRLKFLPLIFCFFVACKKHHEDVKQQVAGQWEWVSSFGGIAGMSYTPQSTGQTWGLKLNADLSFIQTGNFSGSDTGIYSTTQETTGSSTTDYLNLFFIHTGDKKYSYTFLSDTLVLDDGNVDGLISKFVQR